MEERSGGMVAPPLTKDLSKSELLGLGSSTGHQRRSTHINDTDMHSPSRGNKTGDHNVERHLYIDSGALKIQETKMFNFKRIKGDCDIM